MQLLLMTQRSSLGVKPNRLYWLAVMSKRLKKRWRPYKRLMRLVSAVVQRVAASPL